MATSLYILQKTEPCATIGGFDTLIPRLNRSNLVVSGKPEWPEWPQPGHRPTGQHHLLKADAGATWSDAAP
jgi:hypothetical protein